MPVSHDPDPSFDGVTVGQPAARALRAAGHHTVDDLPERLEDLLSLHGIGPLAVDRLRQARRERHDPLPVPVNVNVSPDAEPGPRLHEPPTQAGMLTIRVDLDGAQPPIWRRLVLPGDITLPVLHDLLQAAIGWTDSHLHRFQWPGARAWDADYFLTDLDVAEGEEGIHENSVRLDAVLREPGDTLVYLYDFGDGWIHHLRLESIGPRSPGDQLRCLGGRGRGPEEDAGGIHRWNELAETLRAHGPAGLTGDLEMYAGWLPPGTDPDAFDADEVSRALADVLVARERRSILEQVSEPVRDLLTRMPMDLADDVAAALHVIAASPVPTAAELDEILRPWQVLLDEAGEDGIRLTAAGWMAPQSCARIWEEGGLAWPGGGGTREHHTPELARLRECTQRAGLVRRWKGRLVLTKAGVAARRDREKLADLVAAGLVRSRSDFENDARVLALLLSAEDASERSGHRSVSAVLASMGWRAEGGWDHLLGVGEAADVTTLLVPAGMSRALPPAHLRGIRDLARRALLAR